MALGKAYISVDFEGLPGVVSPRQLDADKPLYSEARRLATSVVKSVAEVLHEEGFDVLVADSHGHMTNVLIEELPEYVSVVTGYPRAVSMMTRVEGCDAALMVGYHARAGTAGATLDHTYSGRHIRSVRVNGVEASEFYLNALVAGYYGVPVVLVAGDDKLKEEVARVAPWAEYVVLKSSVARYAAVSPSLKSVDKELREAVRKAVRKLRSGEAKPVHAGGPVNMEIEVAHSGYADVLSMAPGAKRTSGRTVSFEASDVLEAYKLLELLTLAMMGLDLLLK